MAIPSPSPVQEASDPDADRCGPCSVGGCVCGLSTKHDKIEERVCASSLLRKRIQAPRWLLIDGSVIFVNSKLHEKSGYWNRSAVIHKFPWHGDLTRPSALNFKGTNRTVGFKFPPRTWLAKTPHRQSPEAQEVSQLQHKTRTFSHVLACRKDHCTNWTPDPTNSASLPLGPPGISTPSSSATSLQVSQPKVVNSRASPASLRYDAASVR